MKHLGYVCCVLVLTGLFASSASASFPGRDGLLAVQPLSGPGVLLVNSRGGSQRRICTSRSRCGTPRHPRWSPDGRTLVFNSSSVHLIYPDGSCLNCKMGGAGTPAFTPNPTLVTFAAGGKLLEDGIDGIRKATVVVGQFSDAVWSAKGELAVVRANRIWVGAPPDALRPIATGSAPSWSPSGSRIAFQRHGWVWVIGARGGAASRLARGSAPAWSPDGRLIAFVGPRHALLVIPASGGRARRVGDVSAVAVDWQPIPRTLPPGCLVPRGSKVLARSPAATVTIDSNSGSNASMGCLRATGREYLLERLDYFPGLTSSGVSAAAVGSSYAALANETEDLHYGGSSSDVQVFDLRTGSLVANRGGEGGGCSGSTAFDCSVDHLVVGNGGISAAHATGFEPFGPVISHPLLNISCPSVSLCVAVDGAGRILSSAQPAGGAGTWSITAGPALENITCPSASLCVGASDFTLYSSTDPTASGGAWTPAFAESAPGHDLHGISCPSASLCVAVDSDGDVITSTDPAGGPGAWTAADVDGTNDLNGVSCPSTSLCLATAYSGNAVVSTDPTGGAGAWHVHSVALYPDVLEDVSCPSAALCVADGSMGDIFASTDPTAATPWPKTTVGSSSAVDCPSVSLCLTVGRAGTLEASLNPVSGTWTSSDIDAGEQLSSISCPTTSLCVAGDEIGNVVASTNPTVGPGAWTVTPVDVDPYATVSYVTTEQIISSDSTGIHVLDTATTSTSNPTAIPPALLTGLSLTGSTLSWQHGSTPESALLH